MLPLITEYTLSHGEITTNFIISDQDQIHESGSNVS